MDAKSPADQVFSLHWYKFTLFIGLAGLAIWVEPKMTIAFAAGAFWNEFRQAPRPFKS